MFSSEEEIRLAISNVEQEMSNIRQVIHYHKMQVLHQETRLIVLKEDFRALKSNLHTIMEEKNVLAPTIEDLDIERFKKVSLILIKKLK